tara:strand:- start:9134 stop:9958 length:825 start_codon:yes stop_codon:yes gene_type:complete
MNTILIPLYKIENIDEKIWMYYKKLVNINVYCIKKTKTEAKVLVIEEIVKNLRDMWVDIIKKIQLLTQTGNVLYMEADTILFKNCDEIFNYKRVLTFGIGYWNMSFKNNNEFDKFEYMNSGLVYFPKNTSFNKVDELIREWPIEGDKKKLQMIFPNYNFNFGNRILDYSGTYWEYIVNVLYYSQFNSKKEGIKYIGEELGLWKYNYRGCLYNKYPNKNLLAKNIHHCHFLVFSSNKNKEQRFNEILKIYNVIYSLINMDEKLEKYIRSINDDMF